MKRRKWKIPYKLSFIVLGIASTVWFLIRVIPKPSRASYPCMRAAAPFMSSFIIYLLSITGSALLFKRTGQFLKRTRYLLAAAAFVGAMALFAFSSTIFPESAKAEDGGYIPSVDASEFPANQPMGTEVGIFPGRVVWEWDPDATNENCTNSANDWVNPDAYFMARNNDQLVIKRMLDDVVKKLTGSYEVGQGWDMLFSDFNQRKDRGTDGYQPGQTIFIKINQGGAGWLADGTPDLSYENWTTGRYPNAETSGPMAVALLDQLINDCGIAQEDIWIGDPNAHILKDNYDQMVALFPDVNYADKDHSDLGRTLIHKSAQPAIHWSDERSEMNLSGINDTEYLWEEMENADYLINLATLKAHARAGVTLTAKNHFGSHANPNGAWPLHDGLVCQVDNDVPRLIRNEYGQYRVLTDIMGHEKLGGNTVLFIVEGLWGGPEAVSIPRKWNSAPFNGDWPSSILGAQDAVALESVCFDLLRAEYNTPWDENKEIWEQAPGLNRPWYGGVDDHLHQAADAANWPAGFTYDPEGDGTAMSSMGVHEHWNNDEDKLYSRNLGYDYGIELVGPKQIVETTILAKEASTVPVIDGDMSDECWTEAQWYHMDQTWITWGEDIDSSDFFGRFKMSWSESANLMYYLFEITDDAFIDGYVFPENGWWNYDVVELFIDEDASGGIHQNDENAFAYHLNVNAPEDGGVETEFYACDLGAGGSRMDYADHLPELALKKVGDTYYWEFSLAAYSDAYDDANPEASRVTLEGGKEIGLSMAYCDNDSPDGLRDNFFGSVWVPEGNFNDHWKNADFFGSARLINGETQMNHAVVVTGSIADFEIVDLNTSLVVHDDLLTVFNDPDEDDLEFTVENSADELEFSIEGTTLKVVALEEVEGDAMIKVKATDGEFTAMVEFSVSMINQAVEVSGTIADFEVLELNTGLVVHDDLMTVFNDPDGDELSFAVECARSELAFAVEGTTLKVTALGYFEGSAAVKVIASDGEYEAEVSFTLTTPAVGIQTEAHARLLRCYPNPVNDLLYIEIRPSSQGGVLQAGIYTLSGILVRSVPIESATMRFSMDLSGSIPGLYLLKLSEGEKVYSSTIIHKY